MRNPSTLIFFSDIGYALSRKLKSSKRACQAKGYEERKWYCVYCVDDNGMGFEVEQETLEDAELVQSHYPGSFITMCRYKCELPAVPKMRSGDIPGKEDQGLEPRTAM